VSARLIFITVAAATAIGSAVVAGLIAAIVCLAAKIPPPTLITLALESAAAVFGGVIALAGVAAALFFTAPGPTERVKPRSPRARQCGETSKAHVVGSSWSGQSARSDRELRAAVKARALVLGTARSEANQEGTDGF
jgi:hypothetical protein